MRCHCATVHRTILNIHESNQCLPTFVYLAKNQYISLRVFLMNLIDLHLTFDNYFLKRGDVQMTSLYSGKVSIHSAVFFDGFIEVCTSNL